MALPAVLTVAGTAGFIAAEVPATTNSNSSESLIVGAVVAVIVALIGGAVQIWVSKRRRDDPDVELTLPARVAVLETNQADIKHDLEQILDHLRPWAGDERRRR